MNANTPAAPADSSAFQLLKALEHRVRSSSSAVLSSPASRLWEGLSFRLRQQWCLVPAGEVHEVLKLAAITVVPGAKPWLMGLANVRGAIVPVVDLAAFLGLPKFVNPLASAKLLLVQQARETVGFLVDEAGGHRRHSADEQWHEALAQMPIFAPVALGAFVRNGGAVPVLGLRKIMASEALLEAGW